MEPRALLADIHALEEEMLAFERKYGVRSETFYAAYVGGEEPEDDRWVLDFGEWASVYRTWLALGKPNTAMKCRSGSPMHLVWRG